MLDAIIQTMQKLKLLQIGPIDSVNIEIETDNQMRQSAICLKDESLFYFLLPACELILMYSYLQAEDTRQGRSTSVCCFKEVHA